MQGTGEGHGTFMVERAEAGLGEPACSSALHVESPLPKTMTFFMLTFKVVCGPLTGASHIGGQ